MEFKRVLLAITLSLAVWMLYFHFFNKQPQKLPEADKSKVVQETEKKKIESKKKPEIKETSISIKPKKTIKAQKQTITTKYYQAVFSNKGASIESLKYGERKIELIVKDEKLKTSGAMNFPIYLNSAQFKNGGALENILWEMKSADKTVTILTEVLINNKPVIIEKEYVFNNESPYFNLTYRIYNNNKEDLTISNQEIIFSAPDFLGPEMKDYDSRFNTLSMLYFLKDDIKTADQEDSSSDKDANITAKEKKGEIKWAGITSRYFVAIMFPEGFSGDGVIWNFNKKSKNKKIGITSKIGIISAKSKIEKKFKVCIGPRKRDILGPIDISLKDSDVIGNMELIEPIRIVVLWSLKSLYKLIGNYGWAIIIFSIITKIIFLPLTKKSTESMKKMQSLSPKLNELKAKYKDKPDVLQRKTMELYKEQGVNPLGGCLPLLLQMPFFIALWSAMSNSLDMYQAPFILWVKDLSMPDTVGNIAGININILPILMAATTFLQSKFSSADTGGSSQQQLMMKILPVIFIFIFWSMPSGLILYWIIQNLFQVIQQVYTNRKQTTS